MQLLDALEPLFPARDDDDQLSKGGVILDHHTCDLFPERWVDLVVVMTCDHETLWERLEQRCVCLLMLLDRYGDVGCLETSHLEPIRWP